MQFLIPDTKKKTKFLFGLTAKDLLFLIVAIVLIVLIWWSSMVIAVKIILTVIVLIAAVFSVVTIDVQKGWRVLANFIRYITRRRKWTQEDLTEELVISDYIRYHDGCYTAVIQLNGLNFSILSEDVQNTKIYGLMQLLQELRSGKFVKLEEPIDLRPYVKTNDTFIEQCEQNLIKTSTERWGANPGNWKSLEGTPDDLKKKILQNQNAHFENFNAFNETKKAAYYLLIQETSEETLRGVVDDAVSVLRSIGLFKRRIVNDENGLYLTEFMKRVLTLKADVSAVSDLPLAKMYEKPTKLIINDEPYQTVCIHRYKMLNDNAWAWKLFNLEDVQVTVNFRPYSGKSVERLINKQFSELKMRMEDTKTKNYEQSALQGEYQIISALLNDLQFGLDRLYDVEFYLTYPYSKRKIVQKQMRTMGLTRNDLFLSQYEGYLNTLPFLPMTERKSSETINVIATSALAGMFPFVIKELFDVDGSYLGGSSGLPVFLNVFHRDDDRKNSNAVIFGAPGGGKSYFLKKLLLMFYTQNKKIYVLDPENEYRRFNQIFGVDYIDLSGLKDQVINPLQVFPAFSENENDTGTTNEVSAHLVFLEQFFQTVLPNLGAYQKDLLMSYVSELYDKFGIKDEDNVSAYEPEKFPTFSDLMSVILDRQTLLIKRQKASELYELENLSPLIMAIKKFTEGGIYSSLWNGKTTLTLNNEFTVFNFQALFASGNTTVVNAQMLLVVKYLNQEIIKNREQKDNNIVIAIDEAHRFINGEFTVGLDFMQQEAKQIRKYFGSFIIATQNINDFCGGSEEMKQKASAVINCCQYSFVFNLAPDDINQITNLYKNYNGGLQQEEINYIASARRGDCLLLASKDIRLPVHITAFPGEEYYFEEPKGGLTS